jgi:hypothetical protein
MKPPKRSDRTVEEKTGHVPNGAQIPEEHDPDQAWVWTEAWQQRLAEAEADLDEGRYENFETMDDLLADLDSDDED